jgi:hypothetical protein
VGDCTVRAICKATGDKWDDIYLDLCVMGLLHRDMPSSNVVWGNYLVSRGFTRGFAKDICPDCYTVKDFCREHPKGIYVLSLDGHVLTVEDGNYFDTWDSGDGHPIFYYKKEMR